MSQSNGSQYIPHTKMVRVMPGGRPTKYNKTTIAKSLDYLDNFDQYGDAIPSKVGLADHLDIAITTLERWETEPDKEQFKGILVRIKQRQHKTLMNKGLKGEYNSNIVKLALGKHGYSDKQEMQMTAEVEAVQLSPEERKQRLRELEIERQETERI